MFIDFFELTLLATTLVGLFSLIVRRGKERSCWPTWLLIPIAIFLALPMGIRVQDPLRPFEFAVFALVFSRWLIALVRRERSLGWAFYIVVLITAERSVHPLARWYAARFGA